MAEITIDDTTGGLSTLAPTALLPNQVSEALNVEWDKTECGERRLGHTTITLDGGSLAACNSFPWVYRHLPTDDEKDAQLWVLGLNGATPVLKYKDTTWHTVTFKDAPLIDGISEYQWTAASLHGKLYLGYRSAVDRLHVFVPGTTEVRRTGMAAPAAPNVVQTNGGGIQDARRYRIRFVERSGTTTLRRSEPSPETLFDPSNAVSVSIDRPALVNEGETHWELEVKEDGEWYRISRNAIATTSVTDTQADAESYVTNGGVLSEAVGAYTLIQSAQYLAVDRDRLVVGGNYENSNLSARVGWTPVGLAEGDGNDERMDTNYDPFTDLDVKKGGGLTGLSQSVNGFLYATKMKHVYLGESTGDATASYAFKTLTDQRGALPGTLVETLDNNGLSCVFALDRDIGPIRFGRKDSAFSSGLDLVETSGRDLIEIWRLYKFTLINNAKRAQCGVYVPSKRVVRWYLRESIVLTLHPEETRTTPEGLRGGWALWTLEDRIPSAVGDGTTYGVNSVTLFADNINDGTSRNTTLVPVFGVNGLGGVPTPGTLWMGESGDTDNGTTYTARITTKQYTPTDYVNNLEVKEVAFFGWAVPGLTIAVRVLGKRVGKARTGKPTTTISFTPLTGETTELYFEYPHVIRRAEDDKVGVSGIDTFFVVYGDDLTATVRKRWGINALVVTAGSGQTRMRGK